jgi:hypothetical protein
LPQSGSQGRQSDLLRPGDYHLDEKNELTMELNPCAPEVVSGLSGVPRAESLAQRIKHSGRGTFDRGDLKEGAVGAAMELLSIPFAMKRLQDPWWLSGRGLLRCNKWTLDQRISRPWWPWP